MRAALGIAIALLSLAAGCGRRAASPPPATAAADSLPIDHVILAIDTLERGVELLRRATGVTAVYGGAHPGRGTQNALVSLGGGQYLELLAPNYADTSATARATAPQRARYFGTFRTLTPSGWAIQAPDAAAERSRLAAGGLAPGEVRPGSRARPDGRLLRWRTLDPWGGAGSARDVLPFVIEWAPDSPHPSRDAPSGCRLVDFVIVSPSADSLRTLFRRAGWPVTIQPGAAERLELALDCPAGRVRFP